VTGATPADCCPRHQDADLAGIPASTVDGARDMRVCVVELVEVLAAARAAGRASMCRDRFVAADGSVSPPPAWGVEVDIDSLAAIACGLPAAAIPGPPTVVHRRRGTAEVVAWDNTSVTLRWDTDRTVETVSDPELLDKLSAHRARRRWPETGGVR
jgi:hypothetical protein